MAQNYATARSYAAPAEKWEKTAPPSHAQVEILKHPRQRPKPVLKTRTRVKMIVTILLVFGVCAGLVTRYAQLAVMNTEINKLDTDIKKEQANLETLELQKTYATNLSDISENAKTKLGMDFPKPDQIVSIKLQQDGETGQAADPKGNQ